MNGDKWKNIREKLSGGLQFLKLGEEPELEDEIQIEEEKVFSDAEAGTEPPGEDFEAKLARNRKWVFRRRIILAAVVLAAIGGFVLYNMFTTFHDYVIAASYENEVSAGSEYVSAGKRIYRYNTDGISCVSRRNEVEWSITYNMQAPIADVCGETMAVAEQQGNQVYVVDEDGLVGNFETLLPILKVRVSSQGVVAVVLQEEDVSWVNLYRADGTAIAEDKTTVTESGYPLDIDLSPDGQKLAVSYLGVKDGIISSDVVFYHFGSAGQAKSDYVVSKETYTDTVIPEIFFTENARAVAVADDGYIVYRGSDAPEQSERVTFEDEILSAFHDEDAIGFLFESGEEGYTYRMELYNYRGRRKFSKNLNSEFDRIKIQNGQILMYSDRSIDIVTSSGQVRFASAYEKNIAEIFYFSEFRKYLVITDESFDRIRIG